MELSLRADVERALQCWRDATTPLEEDPSSSSISTSFSSTSPCRAWSYADFAARVASFSVASWFAKPLSISPLACARFGWTNTQPDVVQCSSCARVLCMKLDAQLSPAGIEAVAATFARQLENAHEPTCPWNRNASPASFTMLPVLGPSQVAETLQQRIHNLLDHAKTHEQLHNALLKMQIMEKALNAVVEATELPGTQELLALVQSTMDLEGSGDSSALLLTATLLSLYGWGVPVSWQLSCSFCNRHVPLVVEELSPVAPGHDQDEKNNDDDDTNDDPQPPAAKRQKTTLSTSTSSLPAAPLVFDPMAAHRWFCPWVTAQRRRDVDDQRMRSVEKAMLEDTTSGDVDVGSITDFIRLPGWIQNATALKHLNTSSSTTASTTTGMTTSTKPPVAPQDALASVQSVLGLPESHF